MSIFATEAPKYWAVGLPAIPLIYQEKRPAILGWQVFADRLPEEEEKQVWLSNYPNGNIGMPLGPTSGLVAIDIDTDDPRVLEVLNRVLPDSPYTRVGQKGAIRIYRYNGERTTRIEGVEEFKGMVCEVLSKGSQFVLPPSIHPKTKQPYVSNVPLIDVFRTVPSLPDNIGTLLRDSLTAAGIKVSRGGRTQVTNFVASGTRDNAMCGVAGLLAHSVTRGERRLVDALNEMTAWVDNYVEQVAGDELSVAKAHERLVHFMVSDVTGEKRAALPQGWDDGLTEEEKAQLGLEITGDHEQWDVDRIQNYLLGQLDDHPEITDPERRKAINVVLDRMARSTDKLDPLDEESILRFIVMKSENTMNLQTLRKQLSRLRQGDIRGEDHNEIANAVLEHVNRYGELRFADGQFWQWKGANWDHVGESHLIRIVAEHFGQLPACCRQTDYVQIVRLLRSVAEKGLRQVEISGLNFANRFLDENGRMLEHHPDYGMTYILPYRYVPESAGDMKLFTQFLMDSWGQDADFTDKLLALQEAIAATMFGISTRFQRAICLYGVPSSGKSQLAAIVQKLLPPAGVSFIEPENWRDRFKPAGMVNKVMNFAGELSESRPIPGEAFKKVVAGEAITTEFKGQTPFDFEPKCAQWFCSNHLPKTKDTSDGFNRRWLFLQFRHRVEPSKKVPELADIIVGHEREAIAAWAVQGLERLKRQGDYTLPSSHMALADTMAEDNNTVRYFLQNSPQVVVDIKDLGAQATAGELFAHYQTFCIGTGAMHKASQPQFAKMMDELQTSLGFQKETTLTPLGQAQLVYNGIKIVKK